MYLLMVQQASNNTEFPSSAVNGQSNITIRCVNNISDIQGHREASIYIYIHTHFILCQYEVQTAS